ncbi:KH domain-containing, RNA-binding, signal transduction-associated protein 2-like [Cimex lectularius]|uniref:K Homology domain-containing protein n=1 Tax=Cimex lectularius TaxID=79782 RepID=A0A8I6RGQ1_CIMLE|nr:KH domain-containing, RNA-binding, signal transduction-associated protein 2-like [Cimex lectularius]
MVAEMDQSNPAEGKTEFDPRTAEFIRDLMKEKINLDPILFPNASRLLEEEIVKAQKGKAYRDTRTPVDLYRERPIRAVIKVQVPIKEHPRFNFVGKLLGPKGNSFKRLQEETMTKMAILGRGSMRDKQKEEECRSSLDPKYSHLADELHVEIAALAPPAEAHARLAYALAELRKYLVPDLNDEIRMEQLREIEAEGGIVHRRPQAPPRSILARQTNNFPIRRPITAPSGNMQQYGQQQMGPPQGGAPLMGGPPRGPIPPPPSNNKVMSILDRARIAMEDNYSSQYQDHPLQDSGGYGYDNGEQIRWKGGPFKPERAGGRYAPQRPSPYPRPLK